MDREIPDLSCNAKREIEQMLTEMAANGERRKVKEIRKLIDKQDEELAPMERKLIEVWMQLAIMVFGRVTWYATNKMITRYLWGFLY